MHNFYIKITKEEYEELNKLSYGEQNKIVESKLSPDILYGYGFYGHFLAASDGEYRIVCRVGDSCD